jgi:hypothetical protein
MNQLTDKAVSFTTASSADGRGADRDLMTSLVRPLIQLGIRNEDFGYHLLRASMVIIFSSLAIRNGSSTRSND